MCDWVVPPIPQGKLASSVFRLAVSSSAKIILKAETNKVLLKGARHIKYAIMYTCYVMERI